MPILNLLDYGYLPIEKSRPGRLNWVVLGEVITGLLVLLRAQLLAMMAKFLRARTTTVLGG